MIEQNYAANNAPMDVQARSTGSAWRVMRGGDLVMSGDAPNSATADCYGAFAAAALLALERRARRRF